MKRALVAFAIALGCGWDVPATPPVPAPHSSAMALTRDGATLFVANPDADSVSVIDAPGRTLVKEIPLGDAPPAPDASGAYAPRVMPRTLTLSPDEKTLYVTGQRSGKVHVIDVATRAVTSAAAVCSEPVGVLASSDGGSVFVACSRDDVVVRLDAKSLAKTGTAEVASEPWALAWSSDGKTLYASQFLASAVTPIDSASMTAGAPFVMPDVDPRGDKRLANGQRRGLYDVANRPGTNELWIAHTLLATQTPQPALDFESTVFAALAVMTDEGTLEQTLSIDAQDVPGVDGAFADVVSGPHAIAFTRDGAYALVVDTSSEDVLVVDAARQVETSLLRPLPGHQPEAIVLSPDEKFAYVAERNTSDVAVLDVVRTDTSLSLAVDGSPIPTTTHDPMPAALRFGQHLFYSANSDEYPITTNHWVSCSTCHLEGRSDAITWRFEEGPRDTPTNAGGMLGTGFLFRTADRTRVQDYWRTINIEQGGRFDPSDPQIGSLLDAIAGYVNYGIPLPIAPTTDATLVARGKVVFDTLGCGACHAGPRFTDSGSGNPTLDLAGPIVLHDVGTCDTTGFPDAPHEDIDGDDRAPCAFDTPSLSGLASSPPYFHDGSAKTIREAAQRMIEGTGATPPTQGDLDALVEYLKSL